MTSSPPRPRRPAPATCMRLAFNSALVATAVPLPHTSATPALLLPTGQPAYTRPPSLNVQGAVAAHLGRGPPSRANVHPHRGHRRHRRLRHPLRDHPAQRLDAGTPTTRHPALRRSGRVPPALRQRTTALLRLPRLTHCPPLLPLPADHAAPTAAGSIQFLHEAQAPQRALPPGRASSSPPHGITRPLRLTFHAAATRRWRSAAPSCGAPRPHGPRPASLRATAHGSAGGGRGQDGGRRGPPLRHPTGPSPHRAAVGLPASATLHGHREDCHTPALLLLPTSSVSCATRPATRPSAARQLQARPGCPSPSPRRPRTRPTSAR